MGSICFVFGGAAYDVGKFVRSLLRMQGKHFRARQLKVVSSLVLSHPLWMPFWRGSVVLAFFAALLLLYIMAGGSGHTTLNEIGSACVTAPQHEATGGRVRIGLCPAEHGIMCGAFCAFALASAVMKVLADGRSGHAQGSAALAASGRPHRKDARIVELRVSGAA